VATTTTATAARIARIVRWGTAVWIGHRAVPSQRLIGGGFVRGGAREEQRAEQDRSHRNACSQGPRQR
jgi:hypothetical protein